MLTDEELPALPPMKSTPIHGERAYIHWYSVDQMREYGRAVEQAAYERAAKACEERAGPIETYNRSYPHYLECAAAIRALAARENNDADH